MSSDTNPSERYVLQRVFDGAWWNGRNWTSAKKRAKHYPNRAFAMAAQDQQASDGTQTRLVTVKVS